MREYLMGILGIDIGAKKTIFFIFKSQKRLSKIIT